MFHFCFALSRRGRIAKTATANEAIFALSPSLYHHISLSLSLSLSLTTYPSLSLYHHIYPQKLPALPLRKYRRTFLSLGWVAFESGERSIISFLCRDRERERVFFSLSNTHMHARTHVKGFSSVKSKWVTDRQKIRMGPSHEINATTKAEFQTQNWDFFSS